MDRWQYRIVNLGTFWTRERLVSALATLGAGGWELVAVMDKASNWLQGLEKGFVLFKRLVSEGEEPDGPWAALADTRECPYCKQPMQRDATECPRCRRESEPWKFFDGYWWTQRNGRWHYLDEMQREWKEHVPSSAANKAGGPPRS